mgnify:CR=1 FL=1|jgi:chromosome segregation ATPase|tara:strand:+ start:866 stop:1087 length:222 start_codon:yes stop_codon:yes gene_type:complete
MQDLEKKITRVEYDIESHSSRILSLETAFKELNSSLSDIQNLLLQIKWIAVGALLVMAFTDDTLGKQLMKLLT